MKLNIGVLFGGKSVEHDISILSALQVMKALNPNKYSVIPLYFDHDNLLYTSEKHKHLATYQNNKQAKKRDQIDLLKTPNGVIIRNRAKKWRKRLKIDLVLPIVHGKGMEDGTISSWLSLLDLPYTSPSTKSAALAQDKEWTKIILKHYHLPSIKTYNIKSIHECEKFQDPSMYPLILKPASLGSSIGIKWLSEPSELVEAFTQAQTYGDKIIIEKALVDCEEYNMACFKVGDNYQLSALERVNKITNWYDFDHKYQHLDKNNNTHVLISYNENPQLVTKIRKMTLKIYQILELTGIIRVDYLYDPHRKALYINEVNTIPGSLSFYLYKSHKITKPIPFSKLLDLLIKEALLVHQKEQQSTKCFNSSVLFKNQLNNKK